jgi:DNA repair protein RadC
VFGEQIAQVRCPQCGYLAPFNDDLAPEAFFRPWHVVHGRAAVKAYVGSLGEEAHEWLLALYVDGQMQLLAVDTVAQGDVSGCEVSFWKLISRGKALRAAGFILVHNHPSGDPRPSLSDIRLTRRLAHVSHELAVPLLDHLIIAGDELIEIGEWGWGGLK